MFVRSVASLCSLVECLWVEPEPAHKHLTRLEELARCKHCSLVREFVNYGQKVLYYWPQLPLRKNETYISFKVGDNDDHETVDV